MKGKGKIGITDPYLLAEWDYERNEKGPEEYYPSSSKKAFWKCPKCGYRYESKINNKANGRKCACCQRKIVVAGINDLATTHPEIAAEWDYEKNGDVKPSDVLAGSGKPYYWTCSEGHSYKATPNHRTSAGRETNCPVCVSGRQTSFAEQAVFFYVKKVFPDAVNRYKDIFDNSMELDIYIPSIKTAIEYDGEAWHKKEKREREKRKYNICRKNGIHLIRLMEKPADGILDTANESISILDGPMYEHKHLEKVIRLLLDRIDPESNSFTRKNPLQFHSKVDINLDRDEMEIRNYMTKVKDSLQDLFPNIAKEWDYEKNGNVTPDKVKPGTDDKYWWICPECKNSYLSSVSHRTAKTKPTACPQCGIRKNAEARSKSVYMIDCNTGEIIKEFNSIREASERTGINHRNISTVCGGKTKRVKAGGYFWKYKG